MRMLRLHQSGELVLVNPAQIQTVYEIRNFVYSGKIEMEDYGEEHGSYIYLAGEGDVLQVDESVEEIDRKIALS